MAKHVKVNVKVKIGLSWLKKQVMPTVTISNTNHTADPSSKVKLDYAGKLKNM
jgi:hypothetical protein